MSLPILRFLGEDHNWYTSQQLLLYWQEAIFFSTGSPIKLPPTLQHWLSDTMSSLKLEKVKHWIRGKSDQFYNKWHFLTLYNPCLPTGPPDPATSSFSFFRMYNACFVIFGRLSVCCLSDSYPLRCTVLCLFTTIIIIIIIIIMFFLKTALLDHSLDSSIKIFTKKEKETELRGSRLIHAMSLATKNPKTEIILDELEP